MTRFEDGAGSHQQVWELLAWYVNGTATPQQRRIVDQHLPHCDACRAEYAAQRLLADHLQRDRTTGELSFAVPDPAPGLARLMTDIDRPAARRADDAPAPASNVAGRRWRLAVAGLAAVALFGTGTLATWDARRADYQTLSSPEPAAPHATIRLVPAPSMRVGELQGALHRAGLQVVAGPTEAGVYSLAPAGGTPGTPDTHDTAAQLSALRATPGILFAEPVGADK